MKSLLEILCYGPNLNDALESLLERNDFIKAKVAELPETLVPRNRSTRKITDTDLLRSLVKTAFDMMQSSQKNSLQKRVLRALLVSGISHTSILKDLSRLFGHSRIDCGSNYIRGKIDFETIVNGCILSKTEFGRKSIKDEVVEEAVTFILDKENITTVSWGNIDIVLSEAETVVLPKITRRTSSKVLWDRYLEYHLANDLPCVKKRIFYAIMKMITRSDQKILSSVDYVQSLLVNDSIENLQCMIDEIICNKDEQERLSEALLSLSLFLKYGYNHHATI